MGRRILKSACGAALLTALAGAAAQAQDLLIDDLRQLSIEDLANITVSSVTRSDETLSAAPAAIYVITREEIRRQGARTIPEMLRLAPNLQVAQTNASSYTITARGLSGNPAAQNFPNKLLVLIDGRSVYSPLYSGVYWDMQDVPVDDIERIEVISGPGATLWGANAVNGVINIITRAAADTQGVLIEAYGGDLESGGTLRFGGALGESLTYRIYAKTMDFSDGWLSSGRRAHDGWTKPQIGFRADWRVSGLDTLSLNGDGFRTSKAQDGAPAETLISRNLNLRWNRDLGAAGDLQAAVTYDRVARKTAGGNGEFRLDKVDIDVQQAFALGQRQQVVWGGGVRRSDYRIDGTAVFYFVPAARRQNLINVFAQDTVAITPNFKATLGVKFEDGPYAKVEALPSLRLAWTPTGRMLAWGSVSRAIRSATAFDRDVVEEVGGSPFLIGGPDFQSEKLVAYELGLRSQPLASLSYSASIFYHVYEDLRSIEPAPGGFIPLRWGNGMEAETWGLEAWGDYSVTDWWRLTAAVNILRQDPGFAPGASGILGVSQLGDDPKQQASLKSSMNLGESVTVDAMLRYVGKRPDPVAKAYYELSGRVGWAVTPGVELAVAGQNLLNDRHLEMPASQANLAPRRVSASLQVRF